VVVLERRDSWCEVARRDQVWVSFMEWLSELALCCGHECSDGWQGRPAAECRERSGTAGVEVCL
jgi:hypothetical protein